MEWLERLNQSINYLEENLNGTISYEHAAQIACCSTFHFQRMFSYIAGIPLSEYIRRRRMTAAAFDLQTTGEKIIDLALKYGYDSPTSFNRAFQSVHGVSPSAARLEGISLKAYPRISFSISIKGDVEMNYKIENKNAFRIVGVKKHMDMALEESFREVPLFWQETVAEGRIPQILELLNQPPFGLLGVSTCMNGKDFDYYIAVATDIPTPEGLVEYEIPAATWAVFECIGPMPQAIQELQKRIVTEWLPTSGYEYADAPDIELYTEGDQQSSEYRSEVWLPVVKKK
ncbi:AraC family transcriptional regulator [Sinanaerobacter chloroacetimidivorans]|uniref:AraC family transcriptional regulator n=1 Tax=Sinanaerobacter chloroacetimidivorans TaxID=2818044 RepID=A0A8J8B2V7_9FIRM|nr:AraC family transcriptional regulator [Sinanaerobacter chloroacetimidivorans]MBR0599122.1 AraC family transcriptional regulator [Sinanaerobacter chloroacetimidivorans]